jgi:catechol 2,3-dioxygenase-like lactoylglutathione lyase family enzyme
MRIGTVHHVSFRIDDLASALHFYVGVLGCDVLDRPPMLGGADGAWLQAGETQVHLIEAPADDRTGSPPTEIIPNACHVAFRVDDLDVAEARLRELGYETRWGTTIRQFFVRDPAGNLIEFQPT